MSGRPPTRDAHEPDASTLTASATPLAELRERHYERASAELWRAPVIAQVSALFIGLAAIPILPGGSVIAGVTWQVSLLWCATQIFMSWATYFVYRAVGARARLYVAVELGESLAFAHGTVILAGLSAHTASVWWLVYFAFCVFDGSAHGAKPIFGTACVSAPITAAVVVYLRSHMVGEVLTALLIGSLGAVSWVVLAKTTDRSLLQVADRDALRDRVVELERERDRTRAEAERRRISMDLHDGIGASLTAARLLAQSVPLDGGDAKRLEMFESLDKTLRDGLSDLRLAVWSLDHDRIGWTELVARLRRQCADLCTGASLAFEMHADVGDADDPSPAVRMTVLRVVQEAATNVARHARATSLTVRVTSVGDELSLAIEDDGIGLTEPRGEGRGLGNMRRRLEELGGTISFEAREGGGTRVLGLVPIPRSPRADVAAARAASTITSRPSGAGGQALPPGESVE